MRFPLAWAETAQLNSFLKYSLLLSTTLATVFAISTTVLSLKAPLIVDRACFSNIIISSNRSHTDQEIESFLRISLEKRFATDAISSTLSWLSMSEEQAKLGEQKELAQKNIRQKILITKIGIQGNTATVEIDRVLAVDRLRTVIPATVIAQVSSVPRTELNPYGLLIEKIELKREERPDGQNK
jgi:hypothetical protein